MDSFLNEGEWEFVKAGLGITGPAVLIDPNIRVKNNWTCVHECDVYDGPVKVSDLVTVFEPESAIVGLGVIMERMHDVLWYVYVHWSEMRMVDGFERIRMNLEIPVNLEDV